MRLIYENVDITDVSEDISIISALHTDSARNCFDMTEITLDNPYAWYGWNPKTGDKIRLYHNSYDTGDMFIDNISPEDGKYVIRAAAVNPYGRMKRWKSWEDATLGKIANDCASEMGLGVSFYDVDWTIKYSYAMRKNETCMEFLSRLMKREGAYVKVFNGKLRLIDANYALSRKAIETINIDSENKTFEYDSFNRKRLSALTVYNGSISATARDAGAAFNEERVFMPVHDTAEAGRWARGLMQSGNALSETAFFETEFNPRYTALEKIRLTGGTHADGYWLIDRVTHDFKNETSSVMLMRAIETVV